MAVTRTGLWPLLVTELRVERRTGDALLVTAPFAAGGLLVTAITVGADTPLLRQIGPGLFWAMALLFGSLVTMRPTLTDAPERRDMLRLLGVDPVTGWLSRALASAVLVLAFEVVLVPIVIVLYDPTIEAVAAQALAALLAGLGIGALGAWASDLSAETSSRGVLVPLIVTPLGLPLVLAAVQIGEGATYGASPWPWLALAVLTDLTILVLGIATARSLEGQPA